MRAHVLQVSNPFDPLGSRTGREVRRRHKISALAPKWDAPFVALLNGKPQLRKTWHRKLRDGDVLVFTRLPRGGNGGGSDPLRIVLMIAVMAVAAVAAPMVAGAMVTAGFGATTAAFASAAAGAAITLAGTALVNVIAPPSMPSTPDAPSPTYSLQAQGNYARIESPIPVQYGMLKFFPDLAAQPYASYQDNDQYLYQLFCLGQGEFDVHEIMVGDTPIQNFAEITTEVVNPGEELNLFPAAVSVSEEISGQDLVARDDVNWSQSGTTITISNAGDWIATGIGVWLVFNAGTGTTPPYGAYTITTIVDATTFRVTAAASATGSGSGGASKIIGDITGITVNAAGTAARKITFDVFAPRGLYEVEADGGFGTIYASMVLQVRRIDDAGTFWPGSAWTTLGSPTMSGDTATPLRRTYTYDLQDAGLARGRYRGRAWRSDTAFGGAENGDLISWAGLRATLVAPNEFGAVTLLAVKMLATNNLSMQASRKIAVRATRKIPVWDGTSWSAPVATRSIAWALADIARNASYGCRLPASKVDLAALLALDAVWGPRGDRFDGRFDVPGTAWDALTKVAFAGRAKAFLQGGRLRVVRDGSATVPTQMFTMRNIVRGSFRISYIQETEATADTVEATYLDNAQWQQNRVTQSIGPKTKPVKVQFFGITGRAHATREALYQAACNRYRRKVVSFETEMEGLIPSIGDLVGVSHDAPAWGIHAEAVGWDSANSILTISERIAFDNSSAHYIGVRRADGTMAGPFEVESIPGEERKMRVLDPLGMTLETAGTDRERTHVCFGGSTSYTTKCKVLRVSPKGLHRAAIEAVVDDPAVYSASDGVEAPPIKTSYLPRVPRGPVLTGLSGRATRGDAVALAWDPSPGADQYEIEFARGTDPDAPGLSWAGGGLTHATTYTTTLPPYGAKVLIRVRALGLMPGPWARIAVGDLLGYFWSANGNTLLWSANGTTPFWTAA